jgi:hypothetical protein
MRTASVLLAGLLLAGCASDGVISRTAGSVKRAVTGDAAPADAERLAAWLEGSFTSAEQARVSEDHVEVLLHHARIWEDRDDGIWLYVEQALAARADAPYRQRVYRVWLRPDGRLESAVFELPNPDNAIGAWSQPNPLRGLSPLSLTKRDG